MTAQTMLAGAGVALILYLIVTTIPTSRRLRSLRHQILVDQTRNCWAEARVLTYKLAREGKLSPRSATFEHFVKTQTFILRRPDEYGQISQVLREALYSPLNTPPAWRAEVETWPPEMDAVIRNMAAGAYHLLRSRRRGRLLLWFAQYVYPLLVRSRRAYRFLRSATSRWFKTDRRLFWAARTEGG
jgi:hypothetical protein